MSAACVYFECSVDLGFSPLNVHQDGLEGSDKIKKKERLMGLEASSLVE